MPDTPLRWTDVRARLLRLSRRQKRLLQLLTDVLLLWLALWLAFVLRLESLDAIEPFGGHAWLFLVAPLIALPLFTRFGLYRAVMRYIGAQAMAAVARAVTISAILLALVIYLVGNPPALIPRSIVVIYWMLSLMLVGGVRMAMRRWFSEQRPPGNGGLHLLPRGRHQPDPRPRVAIYGAGAAGNQLMQALRLSREMLPVAFIDDKPELAGNIIAGLPVYGPDRLDRLLADTRPNEILLAIPSTTRQRRGQIVETLARYKLPVRTVPGIIDLASGRVEVQDLREVDIADLLGRDPVPPQPELFARCIRDQAVLVTGAGGSIGAELCRQILRSRPRCLVLYEHSEFGLYRIHTELSRQTRDGNAAPRILPILGSVRDPERLAEVMSACAIDTVYHAAAYKHVPMVERNIAEGIANNTLGTLHAAQAALRAGVANFVLVSTDKAVRPTNIMGGTKRMAELVLQALAMETTPRLYRDRAGARVPNRTRYTMVRFGNVLGSSGSVIPLFREQIRRGGPVTVTHPEITRYFMTIPEAAQLVIQAGSMGEGGDVFVLDMGEPVKIAQLAEKMILLSGLSVRDKQRADGDIAIHYTGLRPGEKLYEELLIGENVTPTAHPMIMRANETRIPWERLKTAFTRMEDAMEQKDYATIRQLFLDMVDGYQPNGELADWMHHPDARPALDTQRAQAPV